jgi:hypothetical protein
MSVCDLIIYVSKRMCVTYMYASRVTSIDVSTLYMCVTLYARRDLN